MRLCAVLLVALLHVGCGSTKTESSNNDGLPDDDTDIVDSWDTSLTDAGDDAGTDGPRPDAGAVDTSPLDVMDRPAVVQIPDDYDPDRAYPLIVLLHGYGVTGAIQDAYLGLGARRTSAGFIIVKPDGTVDAERKRFWNASWCCDFGQVGVDDVAYVSGLIEAAKTRFNIDERRVYLFGHSNGGFMSYRMACEVDGITAIASIAGSTWLDPGDCLNAAGPVSVLQIHGTRDQTIPYEGSAEEYPSARETVARWVGRNGCDAAAATRTPLDFDSSVAGDETTIEAWSGCDEATSVELWTIVDGAHIPAFTPGFIDKALEFLLSHSAP